MVNILPAKDQQAFRARYYASLFTTFFLAVSVIIAIGAGLLVPSYFLAEEQAASSERYLSALKERLRLEGAGSSGTTLATLEESVGLLKEFDRGPLVSQSLAALATARPAGVVLHMIRVVAASETERTVTVSGVAGSRANLLEFVTALQAAKNFKNVSVPVSDLAAEIDLEFSLSFALAAQEP